MILPPRLRPGQKLGIVAPAGPVRDRDLLARGLARLGGQFEIVLAGSLERDRDPEVPSFLAASDEQRAEELDAMLGVPNPRDRARPRRLRLMRILPRLDPDRLRRDPSRSSGSRMRPRCSRGPTPRAVRGITGR